MTTDILKQMAVANALFSIKREKRFPRQIFVRKWIDYLFFDPGFLFEARFIDVKNLLLEEDNASTIAVVNLRRANAETEEEPEAIFLDRDTKSSRYIAELIGDGAPTNWMFLMDRYVLASESSHWSIYCEKENDIAVLAVCEAISQVSCSQVAGLLKAKSIRSMLASDDRQSFDFERLVPEWKATLALEYQPSNCSA